MIWERLPRTCATVAGVLTAVVVVGCSPEEGSPVTTRPPYPTTYFESSSVFDTSNPAALAGFATDVFFGVVVESIGSTERRGQLETQFSVKVTDKLKGNAVDQVTVNQRGGLKDNVVYLESGDELLVLGQQYLIAAKYNEQEDWYTLVPIAGDIPVTDPAAKSDKTTGRQKEDRGSVKQRMADAIARAIPFDQPSTSTDVPTPTVSTPPSLTPTPTLPPTTERSASPTTEVTPTTR